MADALRSGRPVVALESTLICHGIPRPRNLELARAVEAAVREAGAVPATIALLDGRIRVGLDDAELERLATRRRRRQVLAARPGAGPGAGGLGATTVAGTIFVAARLGIRLMATGGIGGVHRGGEASLDVSADLHELARTGVAVVCSGAKIILDLPRTLEVLETLGVPVVGYGTADFPAFYAATSGLPVPRVDGLDGLARRLPPRPRSAGPAGMVVANPPPEDSGAGSRRSWRRRWPRRSPQPGRRRRAARTRHLSCWRELAAASGGRTVTLNEALVLDNARLAAARCGWAGGPPITPEDNYLDGTT